MPKLTAFENVSLDGRFVDARGDMSWAHVGSDDPEFAAFVAGNASGGGALLMGRITYEMMAGWWPTEMAMERDPVVARRMNEMPKYVASRTLRELSWSNATVLEGELGDAVRALKEAPGPDITILGSGSLLTALAREGLIDVIQLVVNPVVLGGGRTPFDALPGKVRLQLTGTRAFAGNGKVVLTYAPI